MQVVGVEPSCILTLRDELPDLFALASGPLQETAQALVDEPIELMRDPKRSVRIQCYRRKADGFLWHVDGGAYGALLPPALLLLLPRAGAVAYELPKLERRRSVEQCRIGACKPPKWVLVEKPSIRKMCRCRKQLIYYHSFFLSYPGLALL